MKFRKADCTTSERGVTWIEKFHNVKRQRRKERPRRAKAYPQSLTCLNSQLAIPEAEIAHANNHDRRNVVRLLMDIGIGGVHGSYRP